MKKSLRLLTLLVATSVSASVLAGCGKKEETSNTTAGTTAKKEVTLKFAVWDYAKAPEYKQIIDSFQADNPNIKIEPLEISSQEYGDKVTIMLASGDNTDVITIKDMPSYSNYAQKKQILAIDDYISKDKVDLAAYNGVAESIKLDSKLYALPFRSDFWVLYYNKGLFDKANVPYPTNDMTWTQFRETAKKLTSGQGNDQVYGAYLHTWKSTVMDWAVANKKGTLTDGKYEFLKDAYNVFLPMQNEDKSIMPLGTAKAASAHYSGQFESGKAAMVPMGTWFTGTLISDKKAGKHNVDWGMVAIPHFDGAKAGTTFGNVTPIAINSSSKNKDEAWQFAKYLGTEKAANILAKNGVMPAYRNEAIMNTYNTLEGLPKDSKKALETSSVALEFPPNANGAAIDKILQEEHELIMIGKNNVDTGIASMNKRVQEVLNSK
jgi:multiple sugar transport system substrate-binding protein